jgi:hypothetical protein
MNSFWAIDFNARTLSDSMAKAVQDNSKDWRKNCATLADQLWYMYEQQLCTNMEIRVMSGQKHRVGTPRVSSY